MNFMPAPGDRTDRAILATLQRDGRIANIDLADYEKVLLDEILAVPAVLTAHSVFAIRTVLSRGPVPLTHWC